MSQENVERVHRAYEAFNRRDLDAFLALMDPEVEFTALFVQMEGDPYLRGYDGIREWWRGLLAVFPDYNSEVLEVRDLSDSLIVALRVRGHGVEGGAPFEQVLWQVVKLRDDKATRSRNFGSETEALDAAGLK